MDSELIILLAEDDAGHGALIKRCFARLGVTNKIKHFIDGQEVLDFFFGSGCVELSPHNYNYLLLLDIRMPKVDGIEVLRRIKEDPIYCKMPVIMVTTAEEPEDMMKCYSYGCSEYMVKPIEKVELARAVARAGVVLKTDGGITG